MCCGDIARLLCAVGISPDCCGDIDIMVIEESGRIYSSVCSSGHVGHMVFFVFMFLLLLCDCCCCCCRHR